MGKYWSITSYINRLLSLCNLFHCCQKRSLTITRGHEICTSQQHFIGWAFSGHYYLNSYIYLACLNVYLTVSYNNSKFIKETSWSLFLNNFLYTCTCFRVRRLWKAVLPIQQGFYYAHHRQCRRSKPHNKLHIWAVLL